MCIRDSPNIRRVMEELGLRIVDINETTRQATVKIVTDGLAEGLGVDDIAAQLTELFDGYSASRAELISRSESAAAYNKASALGYEESGVVSEIELADNDSHADDPMGPTNTTCADRAGLVVSLADVGDYIDSMHPNCQMATIPILATPLGE